MASEGDWQDVYSELSSMVISGLVTITITAGVSSQL